MEVDDTEDKKEKKDEDDTEEKDEDDTEEKDEKDEKDKKGGSDISLNVNQEGGVGDENIKHVTVTTFF